ncbi:MAG: hypothetical protein PHR53_08565 [Bacteroidales bacterium]|nr:hypothetical protein [Bacteroidales bacterium]
MKKLFFMTGCVVLLSLSMVFSGCKKKDSKPDDPVTTTNQYTVGTESFDIQSGVYGVFDNCIALGFISSGSINDPSEAVSIQFRYQNSIPIGTFQIDDENNTGEVFLNAETELDFNSGKITISASGNTYTVSVQNAVLENNQSFTLTYVGTFDLINPDPPSSNNYFTFGNAQYDIVFGGYSTETSENSTYTAIAFLDGYDENSNMLSVVFEGNNIQTGTFTFSLTNVNTMGVLAINTESYIIVSGDVTVQKSGDNYTIDIPNGNAALISNPMGTTQLVTCHFEGSLIELTAKYFMRQLTQVAHK